MHNNFNSKLSIVLLIGLCFKDLPLRYFQPFLQKSMEIMQLKHSSMFTRLSDKEIDFVVDAVDLPFVFYLKPNIEKPILRAVKRTETIFSSALVRGSFSSLLKLFEGKLDGDAAFFSKELIIEGSTAATVALRNAIDSEDMNILQDLSEIFKPFEGNFINLSIKGVAFYNNIQDKIDTIVKFINNDVNEKASIHSMQMQDVFKELDELQETVQKINKEQIRKKTDYIKND